MVDGWQSGEKYEEQQYEEDEVGRRALDTFTVSRNKIIIAFGN